MKKQKPEVIVTWPKVPNTNAVVFKPVSILGMDMTEISYQSCVMHVGVNTHWATIYDISSTQQGMGHAQELINHAKAYYEHQGKIFGSTVALSPVMKHILIKLGIPEYK